MMKKTAAALSCAGLLTGCIAEPLSDNDPESLGTSEAALSCPAAIDTEIAGEPVSVSREGHEVTITHVEGQQSMVVDTLWNVTQVGPHSWQAQTDNGIVTAVRTHPANVDVSAGGVSDSFFAPPVPSSCVIPIILGGWAALELACHARISGLCAAHQGGGIPQSTDYDASTGWCTGTCANGTLLMDQITPPLLVL